MAKTPAEDEKGLSATELAIVGAVFQRMADRDNQMWQQVADRDNTLQSRLLELLERALGASAVDNVLSHGLGELSERVSELMAPLRQLGPRHTHLSLEEQRTLATLNYALKRPDFKGPAKDDSLIQVGDRDPQTSEWSALS